MESGSVTWVRVELDLVIEGATVRYVVTGEPETGFQVTLDPVYADYGTVRILDTINVALSGILHDCTLHTTSREADELPEEEPPEDTYPRLRAL